MCSRLFFPRTVFCVFGCIFQLGVVPDTKFEIFVFLCLSQQRTGLDLVASPDKKYPDLASVLLQIHSVLKHFHSGERIQKGRDSPVTCGRKPYPEIKSFGFKLR